MEHGSTQDAHHIETSRIFVILVGGPARQRASICSSVPGEKMHIEPVWAAGELGLRDLTSADVLVAWDDGDTIEELKGQLAIVARWAPIIAVSESPTTAQVVRAMKAGAIDYIDWNNDRASMEEAVDSAMAAKRKVLPKKQWQMDCRRLLRTLSPREKQVLDGVAEGLTNKVMANSLDISPRTVEIHRANLMRKLRVSNTAALVRIALEGAATAHWIYGDNWLAPTPAPTFSGGNDNK